MGRFILRLIVDIAISALAIGLTAAVLPGLRIQPFDPGTLVLLGIVIGIVDGLIRPVVSLLSLPITILTLGLFQLIINTLMLYLVSFIVPALKIDNFLWALLAGIVLAIVHAILEGLFGGVGKESKRA